MKTKEFIEKLRNLGYDVDKNGSYIFITNEWSNTFATIILNKILGVDTDYSSFKGLEEHEQILLFDLLFDLIIEYARTPLEEREEEKKYYVKLNNPILNELADDGSHFLNQGLSKNHFLADKDQENGYQTQFTQKEINNFPDEVKEILPLCKQIEVTP